MNSIAGFALLGGFCLLLVLLLRAAAAAAARSEAREEAGAAQHLDIRKANDIQNKVASDAAYRERVRGAFRGDA
jgi:hypothetical protein